MKQFVLFVLALCYGVVYGQQSFKPGCKVPFDAIKVTTLSIDKTCPAQGTAVKTNSLANANQNKLKNNFCAKGEETTMKVKDFIAKHEAVMNAGVTFGGSNRVPIDREPLRNLGEGSVVVFIGYIQSVKYSNVGKGESVNCKKKGKENNDIHIELTDKRNEEDKCQRISAEISPHLRPEMWNVDNLTLLEEGSIKIRITGQLFFDASHGACPDSESGYRASSWEIHPVYKIEVYSNKEWIEFDAWLEEE